MDAKKILASQPPQKWTHEYLPISGYGPFLLATQRLALGDDLFDLHVRAKTVGSIQALSGTGALYLGAALLSKFSPNKTVLLPNPTWGNHHAMFREAGLDVKEYRYIDFSRPTTPALDFEGFKADLEAATEGTTVLLHMCAHNPTGVDPTPEQWSALAQICLRRKLQVFFDNAYQGFASGDLDYDASSLRAFISAGLCPLVACSFAKNMGLYGERCGVLHVVAPDEQSCKNAMSQVSVIARTTYSNPPAFGASVAHLVLSEPALREQWKAELVEMSSRIKSMRQALKSSICKATGDGEDKWNHITSQIGMFSYTGLTPSQVAHCAEHGSLFMLNTGRVSMAGVNEGNVERVGATMAAAIKACPSV